MLHLGSDAVRRVEDGKLIALIADETTCVGFLLAGIGECDKSGQVNFLSVNEATKVSEIEMFFNDICQRHDVAILMIDEDIARKISQTLNSWRDPFPIIVEIPSKRQLFGNASEVTLNEETRESFSL